MDDFIDRRKLIEELSARLDIWKGLQERGGSFTARVAAQELQDVLEIVQKIPNVDGK